MIDLPIIDISSPEAGAAVTPSMVAEVDAACARHGFFLVTGHGVPDEVISRLDTTTRAFYAQPEEFKAQFGGPTPEGHIGFRSVGKTASSRNLGYETPTDLVENFGIRNPDPTSPYAAYNKWPTLPADLQDAWTTYWYEMIRLQNVLLRIFESALELPSGWFDDKFDDPFTGLKSNHYPPQAKAPLPGQFRRGAHVDYGFMTLLYQDDAPGGLQVEVGPGVWVDVAHVPDTYIINVAELLQFWTNGRWKSSMHRVVNPPRELAQSDRLSIPFFVNPNRNAVVSAIPSCSDGTEREAVLAGNWVSTKLARSSGVATA